MMMKDKAVCTDTGMLLVRLGLGLVFAYHGWGKLQAMDGTIAFFAGLGIAPIFGYLVAWIEFLGGISMLAGLWTKWSGIALAVVMVFAAYYAYKPADGFTSYEFPLSLAFASLGVAFAGPGLFTVHKFFGGK